MVGGSERATCVHSERHGQLAADGKIIAVVLVAYGLDLVKMLVEAEVECRPFSSQSGKKKGDVVRLCVPLLVVECEVRTQSPEGAGIRLRSGSPREGHVSPPAAPLGSRCLDEASLKSASSGRET